MRANHSHSNGLSHSQNGSANGNGSVNGINGSEEDADGEEE